MFGLLGAAVLNGQFQILGTLVQKQGMAIHRWRSVGYAAICASAVFSVTWFASQRLLRRSPFRTGSA
jgi:hypothetical protein